MTPTSVAILSQMSVPSSASTAPAAGGAGASSQNVKVAVRVRPFNKREMGLSAKNIVEVRNGCAVAIKDPSSDAGKGPIEPKTFAFDYAFDTDSTQSDVYDRVGKPLLDQALNGFNGTIFAYGQTGSGKSWSMSGNDEQQGIIPRMIGTLFAKVRDSKERIAAAADKAAAQPTSEAPVTQPPAAGSEEEGAGKPPSSSATAESIPAFQVTCSYLELYNEVVKDLLNPSDKQLVIREHPKLGVYVQDLAEIVVGAEGDVLRLLEQGQRVRHVAATQMNERSSRSHSIFTLRIEQRSVSVDGDKQTTRVVSSRINLVDLAGSERASKTGATGDVLKQGAAINKVRPIE